MSDALFGIRNGMDLYFAQNNNKIGNRPVQIQYEDEEGNPQTALRKYQQLVTRDQVRYALKEVLARFQRLLRQELRDQVGSEADIDEELRGLA